MLQLILPIIIDIVNIHCKGWPLPSKYDSIKVSIKESRGPRESEFAVYKRCFDGICACKYVLDGSPLTMKPCRMFTECFMWGEVDCNWEYLTAGTVFGFRIVNPDCPCEYENDNYSSILKDGNREFMSDRLKLEIERGQILEATIKP